MVYAGYSIGYPTHWLNQSLSFILPLVKADKGHQGWGIEDILKLSEVVGLRVGIG